MFYPFLVTDPLSKLNYRLSDTVLAELSLAPRPVEWMPGRVIASNLEHAVWGESLVNAPIETTAAVTAALEDLVLATADLTPPNLPVSPDSRAVRHLAALIALWRELGDALPEGLAPVRHVLSLPHGRLLSALPVVEGSLDPLAPASMGALYARLKAEFGTVAATPRNSLATPNTRLHALQGGVTAAKVASGLPDASLAFYGLRDAAACAEFAAAHARALIKSGVEARDIAVLAADTRHLARAFDEQGVPLSGLPALPAERDLIGETAFQLVLAKHAPTPTMVLASLALSPLMPWVPQTGRDLAESLMAGDFRGEILIPEHKALWDDVRRPAGSLAQLRFLIDRICSELSQGDLLRKRLLIPPGDGPPDWETILRGIRIDPDREAETQRNLEGVSFWSAYESPWRSCRHLIVADFTDGFYPTRPRANPLFLDSEITAIRAATGLHLRGRTEALAQSVASFDEQLQAVSDSVTFLTPSRDLTGGRLAPSVGLSLIARAIDGVDDAVDLVTDVSAAAPDDWPVPYHYPPPLPPELTRPEVLNFGQHDLLALRREDDGTAKPQSPSRLEVLLVSPLAWLLGEIGAEDMVWLPEDLDIMAKGSIAHDVFEQSFPAGAEIPEAETLKTAVAEAYDRALSRHAGFLRSPSWEMERNGLEREILGAALLWRQHLLEIGATIVGNELWLAGKVLGIQIRGKADAILELPDGALIVIDHKKSGTSGRQRRMAAGWDLQAGLYRDMIVRPIRREGDGMDALIGRETAIGYYLMNDGGLLTSGLELPEGSPARDMGDEVNDGAMAMLKERLAELKKRLVVLNTTADAEFFRKECGFTPYALTAGSPLVGAFMHEEE
ncbi:PD-(D/E)XK nuclease family protein [Paracoccus sp. SCSIO 75233]|uniref:PD-(D/E)XK nuclease family protein n=1 Tax=Paracoccus sp. SCSIO 75233 TaxID=3017782 RepID=UPI0022F0A19A|nr:PD-(D/E)XK nuclease family protein [Paracoccus sp. SCSIO 75233]WBU54429.1 PD-(D/E)XK nuclease family protein [Paracoccus sp. SCSIO 75233]